MKPVYKRIKKLREKPVSVQKMSFALGVCTGLFSTLPLELVEKHEEKLKMVHDIILEVCYGVKPK